MNDRCDRRAFVKGGLAATTGVGLIASGGIFAAASAQPAESPKATLPQRLLGKTGRQVSLNGLGGLFTVSMHDRHDEAVEIVNRAIDLGVNYIDTSAWYGTGASELTIGTVMKKRRSEVFLVSAVSHLEENVGVARAFEPLGEKEMAEIRAAARS